MNLEDLFKVVALTEAINKTPTPPSRIGSSGLFTQKSVSTDSILVENKAGRLILVKAISRDADPVPAKKGPGRNARDFRLAHIPLSGVILPSDIAGLREFGQEATEDNLVAVASVVNDSLDELKASLEATREWQRLGAIKGVILDADGDVIYDLFSEYGITKKADNLALSSDSTKVRAFCQGVGRHIDKNTPGLLVSGKRAYCGSTFFDAFVEQKSVREAFLNYQEAQDKVGGDVRSGFTFGGIEWVDYPDAVGATTFIDPVKAHVFPVATGAFTQYNGPANYNEAVNTRGKPFYAKAEPRKMGKGYDLEAQTNTLALCQFPGALYELTAT